MYTYETIWRGAGILLYRDSGSRRTSVGIGKEHLSYAIRYLEDRITGFHSIAGRLDLSRSTKGITLTDYQGRRLHVPNKDVSDALGALYRAHLSARNLIGGNPMARARNWWAYAIVEGRKFPISIPYTGQSYLEAKTVLAALAHQGYGTRHIEGPWQAGKGSRISKNLSRSGGNTMAKRKGKQIKILGIPLLPVAALAGLVWWIKRK